MPIHAFSQLHYDRSRNAHYDFTRSSFLASKVVTPKSTTTSDPTKRRTHEQHHEQQHESSPCPCAIVPCTLAGSTFGLAPRAFAEDAALLPVAKVVVPTQTSPEATSEALVGKSTVDPATRLADVKVKVKGAAAIAQRQVTLSELTAKIAARPLDCGSNAAMNSERLRDGQRDSGS